MSVFDDRDVSEFASLMAGEFYQCFYERSEKDMVSVIEDWRESPEMQELCNEAISKFLEAVEAVPEVEAMITKLGSNYDPRYDGMSSLEWLVLIKHFMKGNKHAFQFMPSANTET